MTFKPAFDPGPLMSRVIVHDHVDLLARGNDVIDGPEELQPFLMAAPVIAHGDDLTFQCVEGGNSIAVPLRL
jgi:hypothetical protein